MLAYHNHQISHGVPGVAISSTENALMHLMGGYVLHDAVNQSAWDALTWANGWIEFDVQSPDGPPFMFKFNRSRSGEGPTINGKVFGSYFHPSHDEVRVADITGGTWDQWPSDSELADEQRLPDLVDGWGTPILYMRQARPRGLLVSDAHLYGSVRPRFYVDNIWPYTLSKTQIWSDPCGSDNGAGSILYGSHSTAGEPSWDIDKALALLMRGPGDANIDPLNPDLRGTPQGSIVLISAGRDGIYLSAADGPGSGMHVIGGSGCGNYQAFPYDQFLQLGQKAFLQFDDIVLFGGDPSGM
jgi:hypothetical protein